VRIFDSFSFTNPVSYVWGSADFDNNTLTLRAPFDERTFTINDYSRSEDFIYGVIMKFGREIITNQRVFE
jgi:hypothetical protein